MKNETKIAELKDTTDVKKTSVSKISENNVTTVTEQAEIKIEYSRCPIPGPKRQYPCCVFERLPYVANLLETAQLIHLSNISLVRFADGDIMLMSRLNPGYQTPDESLVTAMEKALTEAVPGLSVGICDCFTGFSELNQGYVQYYSNETFREFLRPRLRLDTQYLSAHISSPAWHSQYTHCTLVDLIYKHLRETWRNKHIVLLRGNNTQVYDYDVYDTAASQTTIYAPRYHAWSAYETLKDAVFKQDPNALYIMAAGPVGKILAYDLAKAGRRALDLGHLAKDYDRFMGNKGYEGFFGD